MNTRRAKRIVQVVGIECLEQRTYLSPLFDVDGDGQTSAITDGIYILRHMAGFTEQQLHEDPATAAEISERIGLIEHMLDVDGDNSTSALTDGVLILRNLAGFNGQSLVDGATNPNGVRTVSEDVAQFLSDPLRFSANNISASTVPPNSDLLAPAKEVIVTIDYFDSAFVHIVQGGPEPNANYIHDLTQQLKANGTDTIVVRSGVLGLFHYETDLSYPIGDFDPAHVDALLGQFERIDGLTGTDLATYKSSRTAIHNQLQQLVQEHNPLETFVTEGRAAGLKVVLWVDLFDDIYPGYRSKFLDENPQAGWQAADGSKHPGLISYAYQESRDFRVAQVQELLQQTGADGIYLSTSAHSRHFYVDGEPDEYGFEPAVVDEYFRQTGDDLLTTNQIDRDIWNDIKGDFMNQLYRDVDTVTDAYNAELWIGQQFGDITGLTLDGAYTGPLVASWSNHTEQLIDTGLADALLVNDYEFTSLWGHPNATRYFEGRNITAGPSEEDLYEWAGDHFGDPEDTRLIIWSPISTTRTHTELPFFGQMVLENGFDGVLFHESINFELRTFEPLADLSDSFSPFVNVGYTKLGLAVGDFERGTGYVLHSQENVHLRFNQNPVHIGNSHHLVAVRYDSGEWQYNNNSSWTSFTPHATDHLIARIDFTADTIEGLQDYEGALNGIRWGYSSSDLTFAANQWAGRPNGGEFEITGSYFEADAATEVGRLRQGAVVSDGATGNGYILFTSESAHTRFETLAPDNSDHLIAVQFENNKWFMNNGQQWIEFEPRESDHLIAGVDFDGTIIVGLQGRTDSFEGISLGFGTNDLSFEWTAGPSENFIAVDGTFFEPKSTQYSSAGVVGSGIAVTDFAVGDGFIMFSEQNVTTRFESSPPFFNGHSQHLIAVRFFNDQWQFNNNNRWTTFTPEAGDRLLASVDFTNDTIQSLDGTSGTTHGISTGYADGDLTFHANQWAGVPNAGEFQVEGTWFVVPSKLPDGFSPGSPNLGVAVTDTATGSGFLLHSPTTLATRFPDVSFLSDSSDHIAAVRFDAGTWYVNNNSRWTSFVPLPTDRLLAAVHFDLNTATSLAGTTGNIHGIHQGYVAGDLTFHADQWAGVANDGEFQVTGSWFRV